MSTLSTLLQDLARCELEITLLTHEIEGCWGGLISWQQEEYLIKKEIEHDRLQLPGRP